MRSLIRFVLPLAHEDQSDLRFFEKTEKEQQKKPIGLFIHGIDSGAITKYTVICE